MPTKKKTSQTRLVVFVPTSQLRIVRAKLVARGKTLAGWVREMVEKIALED